MTPSPRRHTRRTIAIGVLSAITLVAIPLFGQRGPSARLERAPAHVDLAEQILETMLRVPGNRAGFRTVHAKGIVCEGTFTPSTEASGLSSAVHFAGAPTPVTVRFSDGASDPLIPDASPDAGPRGMAIRFALPGGSVTDIVAMSHNGFVVGTGEEFLALQRAVVDTDPQAPHPWPVETFLAAHPRAAAFVRENRNVPASFATDAFFSNNAFVFVDTRGHRQPGRYQLLPAAGRQLLSERDALTRDVNYLMDDLASRLAVGPVVFRLQVQLPNPGDPTRGSSLVWPDDRRTVDLGRISVTRVLPDDAVVARSLAFDPVRLTVGIELSDDPLPALRSRVYALAVQRRLHPSTGAR
ncbi:MAG: catalase family peroxidase [Vicinamibacterales bacterium]